MIRDLCLFHSCPGIRHWECRSRWARVAAPDLGGWTLSVGSQKKRVLTLLEELVGRGCPARSRVMDERVRNASPLVVAACKGPVAPKMPNDVKDPVVPSCPRVVGGIYQPSYIYGNLVKTHQNRDAVLPVAAGGGPFQMPLFMLQSGGRQAAPDPACSLL